MDNKDLIAVKQAQIEILKKEIQALRGPRGIASLMNNNFAFQKPGRPVHHCSNEWNWLRRLCLRAFEVSSVKELTEDQMRLAAEIADEMLLVFNKYYNLIHNKEK